MLTLFLIEQNTVLCKTGDRLMLSLFNRNILSADDFMNVGSGGIYLSPSGKKKFFIHYERLVGLYKEVSEDKDYYIA